MDTLNVYANPYVAFDHKGRPCGVVLCDPIEHISYSDINSGHATAPQWEPRRFIGAELDQELTKGGKNIGHVKVVDNEDTVWKFSGEMVSVPITDHYKYCVRTGDLIAGDVATAKLCGIKEEEFLEPKKALAAAKRALAAKFKESYPEEPTPEWARPPVALVKESKKEVA